MSLQFDEVGAGLDYDRLQRLPPAFLGEALPGTSVVSRLFFKSLDAVPEEFARVEIIESSQDMDGLLAEIAALKLQLQRQAIETCDELERVRRSARGEARLDWEAELDERLTVERELVLQSCERFRVERERYFAEVEAEVVKLSIAIAQRILHREVLLDPLMLASAARVALERVSDESGVSLRVPAEQEQHWRSSPLIAQSGVELVADKKLATGECVIETSVGRVELGVGAQLAEIESGFFDLLQRRPA